MGATGHPHPVDHLWPQPWPNLPRSPLLGSGPVCGLNFRF